MSTDPDANSLHRLWGALSLRTWLILAGGSFLLAMISGLYLAVLAGMPLPQPWAQWFDRSELFIRDTIRLTFRDRRTRKPGHTDHVVAIAPVGILEPQRNFQWLTATDLERIEKALSNSWTASSTLHEAPARVLDPSWNPMLQ